MVQKILSANQGSTHRNFVVAGTSAPRTISVVAPPRRRLGDPRGAGPVIPIAVGVVAGETTDTATQMLVAYQRRIEALERQVAELRKLVVPEELTAPPLDAAKSMVRKYFAEHDGEVIYPSDVADALNLRYDIAQQAIAVLEAEGKIAKA
jgi:hypothetical protein